ncbi:MAG: DUF86 domain-containing protein [Chloroflexi bacterium]|nr:DUF86 domain-containing protein [Chloroflexota bacterium]
MKRTQRLYCNDILDRIRRIEVSTEAGRETFDQSREKQDAVIFCFIIIGEAIKHMDADLLAQQPHIDWGGFARFRDFLVHQYHNTEIEIAWRAAKEDLPDLKAAVTSILSSLDASEEEA